MDIGGILIPMHNMKYTVYSLHLFSECIYIYSYIVLHACTLSVLSCMRVAHNILLIYLFTQCM